MKRALLTTVAALTLGGCAVGPHYRASEPPAPQAFVAATPETTAAQAPPDRWWSLYQDPAIDALVEQALAHNTDLRAAAANLAEARAALLNARAGLLPSTQTTAGETWGKGAFSNFAARLAKTKARPGWDEAAQVDASWEVDLFGRVRSSVLAAKRTVQAEAAAQDFVRVSVAAETTRAYLDACAHAQQTRVARRALDLVSDTLEITRKRVGLGAASDFDLARAATLVEQTRAAIPPLEDQRRAALFQLSVLTGRAPEEIDAAAARCERPPTLAQALPVGDGALLLRRRPDVRQAERMLAASVSRVDVAVAGLFPTVTLGGGIGGSGAKPGAMFGSSGLTYSAGPLISWNFPNLVAQQGQVAQAKAASAGALAQFDGAVLRALQDVETALSAYAGELDRHAALTAARDQAALAEKLAKVRYERGQASYLDLITAQQTLVGAELSLANSDLSLINDQVAVFKSLGGGWQGAPTPVTPTPWKR